MSDERILGDSDFVDLIMNKSEERYDRRQRLKQKGFNLDRIAERVAEVLEMETDEVYLRGRQDRKVKARSLLCFWASRTELAKRLELSLAAIGFSVERGELIAKEGKYFLEKEDIK